MTPLSVRQRSIEKRARSCVICGASFLVKSAGRIGLTCSKPCLSKRISLAKTGTTQSEETKAKRSVALRKYRAENPERSEAQSAAATAGRAKWLEKPENAAAAAKQMSDFMKALHTDPEFQERRNQRSARTMKANWDKYRSAYTHAAVVRYAAGLGLNSDESKANKAAAGKWIMKRAQAALHPQTDYDEVFAEVQAQLRREQPFDGPAGSEEYFDYLAKLGALVASDPRCRTIFDAFMSQAIPLAAAEWQARKLKNGVTG